MVRYDLWQDQKLEMATPHNTADLLEAPYASTPMPIQLTLHVPTSEYVLH